MSNHDPNTERGVVLSSPYKLGKRNINPENYDALVAHVIGGRLRLARVSLRGLGIQLWRWLPTPMGPRNDDRDELELAESRDRPRTRRRFTSDPMATRTHERWHIRVKCTTVLPTRLPPTQFSWLHPAGSPFRRQSQDFGLPTLATPE